MQTFQQTNEASSDIEKMLPKIYRCSHCGEEVGKTMRLYCNDCTYAKARQEMCEENQKINPDWHCNLCKI